MKAGIREALPTLTADMEWSVVPSGRGALLLEDDRIFAEILVDDTEKDGFGLFLEDKERASEIDVWLDSADEVVSWICDQLGVVDIARATV